MEYRGSTCDNTDNTRSSVYRGSTCDNTDITDNESGIYAMFGFLSLYDLTGQQKWLDALIGAADYTETWDLYVVVPNESTMAEPSFLEKLI